MEKPKKSLRGMLIALALGAVTGLIIGVLRTNFSATERDYESSGISFMRWVVLLVSLFVSVYLHTIIHEAGHLIAGKLSGYKFVSFRVGKLTIIRKEDKLLAKKYELMGTIGQCLMSPPEVTDTQYKFPIAFYNLGGGLANILFAALFFIVGVLTSGYVSVAFMVLAIVGVFSCLANIIPLKLGGIANDGSNIIACRKSAETRRALWIQLKFVALITQGVRVCDMPQEWMENIATPTDALTGFLPGLRCSYHLDKGEIQQAYDYAKSVLENPGKMLELHKYELRCEMLFCELVSECRPDEIKKLYTAKLREYISAHATHVSKQRLMYAYERLYAKYEVKAKKTLESFERTCLHTPFQGEIAGERELIELVKRIAK